MKLKLREKIWCYLFKIKFIRIFFFYRIKRYKKKLNSLDNLKLNLNSSVVDIGGNNGVVSSYIFDKYNCYINIFEPNPYCALILRDIFLKNIKVKIYEKAISNTNGTKKLYFHQFENDFKNMSLSESPSLEIKKKNISKEKYKNVKTVNMSFIFKKMKIIDFMKIDIEGHEYKIFPDIIKNIKKIKLIFCEMHGETHRKEFNKKFNIWNKKLKKLKNTNFFYW